MMEWINCWYETRSALVISVVLEGVHPRMILACTSYEAVSLLVCDNNGRARKNSRNSRHGKEMRRHLKVRNAPDFGLQGGTLAIAKVQYPSSERKQLMCVGSSIEVTK
jgi:hypothetical protein